MSALSECEATALLELDVEVICGQPWLGVLTRNGGYFFAEVPPLGIGRHRVAIQVPPLDLRGNLVVRNTTTFPSQLRICPVALSTEPQDQALVELASAYDQFLATGSALLNKAVTVPLPPQWQSAYSAMLSDLTLLVGGSYVSRQDNDFDGVFAALDDAALCSLAQSVVLPASAPAVRGWKFDWPLSQTRPKWQFRSALWRAMKNRLSECEVALPWLEGTKAWMPLYSDLSVSLFIQGQFEPNICRVIALLGQPGGTVVDVGANEGLYTLLAAARVGPSGRVIAIEPSPREFARLERNARGNALDGRVILNNAALGGENTWTDFVIAEPSHAGQNALAAEFDPRLARVGHLRVPVTTLDTIAGRLRERRIDLVKIDVEGAEFEVLEGSARVLKEHRPAWVVEVGRTGSTTDWRVVELLINAGYRVFNIDDATATLIEMTEAEIDPAVTNVLALAEEKSASALAQIAEFMF